MDPISERSRAIAPRADVDGAPDLSVVLVTPDHYDTIRTTIRHLRAQTARGRIEVVIAAPSLDGLRLEAGELDGFFGHRVIEVGQVTRMAEAKVLAIRATTAPVVAFGEDHCFPAPRWAEALIAAHRQGWAGVGPVMRNANPATKTSWAGMFMHFGSWVEPASGGEVPQVAWHNGSFKRELLLDYGPELPRRLVIEGFLQDDLRAKGHRLYMEPGARVYHVNISRLAPWTRHAYFGGRLFAASRVHFERWSIGKRVLHVAAAPLVPFLRLRRTIAQIRRADMGRRLLPGVLGPVIIGLLAHALGELAGYVFGAGDAELRYSNYEAGRWRFVTPHDLAVMTEAVLT